MAKSSTLFPRHLSFQGVLLPADLGRDITRSSQVPTIGIGAGRDCDAQVLVIHDLLGINEHVHTVWAYLGAFTRAGLVVRRVERADGWPPVPFTMLTRLPKVGPSLAAVAHLTIAWYCGVSIYARKR